MKQKILYVIENIFFGGGERVFAQIINGLDKEKFEIYVASLPDGIFEEKIKASAKLLPFKLRNRFSLLRIYRLAKIMKEKNIQIVHSQGGRADFFVRIAAKIAKVPAVISTIAMPVEGYNVGLLRKVIYVTLDRFSERLVDKFIVVSEALRKRLIRKHGIASERIVKIYNGVEIEKLNYDSANTSSVRKELNVEATALLIGTIGRLVWQKGLTYFMRAVKQIVDGKWQMAEQTKFLIVGEGRERKRLESMAHSLNLGDKIIFTGFRSDIKEILYSLDILVLSSVREGQPITLLEAMALGKPIVATNIEGINETVIDGETGILVPPKDSHALAEAIVCLLKDNKKAQKMAQAARKVVEERFNLKDKINQHKQLYETIGDEE